VSSLAQIERREFEYAGRFIELAYPNDPAAGANLTVQLDSRWINRILSARITLVTDSNAANRALTLDYLDAASNVYDSDGAGLVQTASTTQVYQFQTERTSGEWASNTLVWLPINSKQLTVGTAVRFTVSNIQVADQLSAAVLLFERYDSG
jgi:hypothetical protein